MSNLSLFFGIFMVLLILGGWISSEVISNRTTKSNKKFVKQLTKLDRENSKLQGSLNREVDRYTQIKEEYDKLRDAKAQIRTLEVEYKKLTKQYKRTSNGIDVLRQKVGSKKYSSNSLAKDIKVMLEEQFPSEAQKALTKEEATKDRFKRIKSTMDADGGETAEE